MMASRPLKTCLLLLTGSVGSYLCVPAAPRTEAFVAARAWRHRPVVALQMGKDEGARALVEFDDDDEDDVPEMAEGRSQEDWMFFDTLRIYVKAGDGGNGCVAFKREKDKPKMGPGGGERQAMPTLPLTTTTTSTTTTTTTTTITTTTTTALPRACS